MFCALYSRHLAVAPKGGGVAIVGASRYCVTQKEVVQIGQPLYGLAATYSPTWYSSTIGANGFNFSVRDGKRWSPVAIATLLVLKKPYCCVLRSFDCGRVHLGTLPCLNRSALH